MAKKIGFFKIIQENIECQSQIIDCLLHFYQDKSDTKKKEKKESVGSMIVKERSAENLPKKSQEKLEKLRFI